MAGKPTDTEINDRLNTVYKDLVDGKRRPDILRYASIWGVTPRTIDNYIARANSLFVRESEIIRQRELGKALARLENAYRVAAQKNDVQGMVKAQTAICALLGLNAPTRTELTGADGGPLIVKGYASVSPDDWGADGED